MLLEVSVVGWSITSRHCLFGCLLLSVRSLPLPIQAGPVPITFGTLSGFTVYQYVILVPMRLNL